MNNTLSTRQGFIGKEHDKELGLAEHGEVHQPKVKLQIFRIFVETKIKSNSENER